MFGCSNGGETKQAVLTQQQSTSMKRTSALLRATLIFGMVPLTGCAASNPLVIIQAVGPARIVAVKKAPSGELLVYSGWERFDTLDADHPKHTPYTLRSAEQSKPIHVINRRGSFGEEPVAV